MAKIEFKDGAMVVPDTVTVPFIEGDGVGVEVTAAMRKIVDSVVEKCYAGEKKIDWLEILAGEKSFNTTGSYLPTETMEAFKEYRVGIKGPLTTPIGGGMRSLNVALRQELDLFVCLRPVRWYKGVVSPLKEPQKVDMHIFRENTEDIYAGIEWENGTVEAAKFLKFLTTEMGVTKVRFPESSSFGVKPVSKEGTERLVKAAVEYALERKLPTLTLVHKGNIMKFTEGGFKKWGYGVIESQYADKVFTRNMYDAAKKSSGEAVAEELKAEAISKGKLYVDDCIADAFLQNTLLKPENYSVIATLNLNGDYISDQLAAMVGGIGIAPGANINYLTGHAIFEATHGTAPDIAGKNCVNPCSLLLSAVMMLDYLGWSEAATAIETALEKMFAEGRATADLARFMEGGVSLTTSEFAEELIKLIHNS